MTQKQKTHRLAVAAMLTAVAAVLQFIEFAIPLMPAFIKLDISDLPALLGTFSLGPVYGVAIQLVKNLLHLPFGSSAGVGELSNFILGAIFVGLLTNGMTLINVDSYLQQVVQGTVLILAIGVDVYKQRRQAASK